MTEAQIVELSSASGVPFTTILKIRYRVTKDPHASTIDALREAFEAQDAAPRLAAAAGGVSPRAKGKQTTGAARPVCA